MTTLNTQTLAQGKLHALTDVLNTLISGQAEMTALELACRIKRAEALLADCREQLVPQANIEFLGLRAQHPDFKQFQVADVATVSGHTPSGTWVYPADLVVRQKQLDGDKAYARENGVAVKKASTLDPASDTLFAITLI